MGLGLRNFVMWAMFALPMGCQNFNRTSSSSTAKWKLEFKEARYRRWMERLVRFLLWVLKQYRLGVSLYHPYSESLLSPID